MASNKSDDLGVPSTDSQSSKSTSKSKRGKVCLTSLAQRRAKGIKLEVEFNDYGQPFGKVAAEMQSYIGMLTREQVKITYSSWKKVPETVKEFIWDSVNTSYKVPIQWRCGCLESASVKFCTWKNRLYTDYIVPNKDNKLKLKKPPADSGIVASDWNEFVSSRTTPEFKKLSEVQKNRRSQNLYPHRLSRRGYARLAEDMKDDLNGDEDIDRAIMWKKARLPKEGSIDNDDLKSAIQRIDDYVHAKEEGNFKLEGGNNDLLTCALKNGEHSGRLLAVGAYVTSSMYFKLPRQKKQKVDQKSHHELEEAKKKIEIYDQRMQAYEDIIHGLVDRMGKLEEAQMVGKGKEKVIEGNGSCSVKLSHDYQNDQDDQEEVLYVEKSATLLGKPVQLMEGSNKRIVAYGTVIVSGDKLHGAPMPKDCLRVSIDGVVGENTLLPFRISDEMDTVESAVRTHVAWPTHLVVEKQLKPVKNRGGKEVVAKEPMVEYYGSLPILLKALYCATEKLFEQDRGVHISLDQDVFGNDLSIWIVKEDLIPFCNLQSITGNCIVAYIWNLYRNMAGARFIFVNPFTISYRQNLSVEGRACRLAERLCVATPNHLVLVPCNVGEHWILTIIEPYKERIYLMDPIAHRNRDATWKSVVETAMKSFKVQTNGKNFKKPPTWEIIKGPMQPTLSNQCGYYVLRFMKEIVHGCQNDSISIGSLFPKKESYHRDEIDEVREEWATCVIDHLRGS